MQEKNKPNRNKAHKPTVNIQNFSPDQLRAWDMYRDNKKQDDIAKALGKHQTTISRWIGSIQEYMKQSDGYQAVIPRVAELLPFAWDVVEFHVKVLCSLSASQYALKIGAMVIDYQNIEDLGKSRISDAEIRERIKGLANQDSRDIDQMSKKPAQLDAKTAKIPTTLGNQEKDDK